MVKELRVNREIRAASVRVIDHEGKQMGIVSLTEALAEAGKHGLDLVEVSPHSTPPVCKIMNYGKFRYQQSKKLQVAKKSQSTIQLKEIRIRPKTVEHDLQIKLKHILKFLDQRNKVKISMIFRGREVAYTHVGMKIMEDIKNTLADTCIVEQFPKMEGKNMTMVVAPKK
ncbi:MAG: translation initiation factor IF-3 [Syntrophaceae bacterium CG2_30_49_12]|nr:MAG: translation initiation factor IF-3 [Syntrophaceae bacterium CG2_30_49_12]